MKTLSLRSTLAALCWMAMGALQPAGAADNSWTIRAFTGQAFFASPSDLPSGEERVTLGPEDELAYGLEVEYRINERLGIELGAMNTRPTYVLGVDFAGGPMIRLEDTSHIQPLTAGLVFHLTPDRAADVTLTPLVGSADYGNQRYEFEGETATLTVGSDFVWGGRLGVDVPIGEGGWGVSLAARYLSSSIDGQNPDDEPIEIDLDPVLLTVGIGYSF